MAMNDSRNFTGSHFSHQAILPVLVIEAVYIHKHKTSKTGSNSNTYIGIDTADIQHGE